MSVRCYPEFTETLGLPAGTGETGPLLKSYWLLCVEGADSENQRPAEGGGT